ncbi:hypothetical protein TELCIR_05461 [Teladorsagia circumcincta]|uniref:CLIP1 zinc knuckle domain-containing protein n=1 Tax=Teladorsagia circumcincta TaxID=45464 RepID=A0A2G9UQV7_TELCI|nr:hypothetical protein TELCIR_05461 [Teladorsagia circumcincta]
MRSIGSAYDHIYVEGVGHLCGRLTAKLEAVRKDHEAAVEGKAQVEEELRKQTSAFNTVQNTVNASNMGQSAMAKELASVTTLCAERLAENNKLQETVQSLQGKIQSMELASTETAAKLKNTEERLNDLAKQKEEAMHELERSRAQEVETRSELEKIVAAKSEEIASLQRNIEELSSKSAEFNTVVDKLNTELSAKDVELEGVRQERNVVAAEKESAETQVPAMASKIQELEQKLVDLQNAMEAEQLKKLEDFEAQGSKLHGELSAANERNNELSNELKLNVEELARLSVQLQDTKVRADEADRIKSELEQLQKEDSELKEKFDRTMAEKEELASNEVAEAMQKVRSAEETKLAVEKVMEQLKSELAEKQREVTSLRLIEANANVMVSEAKQKIDLFNELEQDWQKKQLRLCEKIDELTIELEQAKNRTQSEEVNSLKRELAFTNSIIADQRRKEVKLQEEIEALKNFSADSVNLPLKPANREVKPRMYCDICETFDQHETEDCPKQEVQEEMVRTKPKKPPPPSREYCDYCEMFGHDTFACNTHDKKKKKDYTY